MQNTSHFYFLTLFIMISMSQWYQVSAIDAEGAKCRLLVPSCIWLYYMPVLHTHYTNKMYNQPLFADLNHA